MTAEGRLELPFVAKEFTHLCAMKGTSESLIQGVFGVPVGIGSR